MRTGWYVLLIALLFMALPAFAEEKDASWYRWKDNLGTTHVTDSLEKVPRQYRAGAEKVDPASVGSDANIEKSAPEAPVDEESERALLEEQATKAEWQNRMHLAKERLARAEVELHKLEQRESYILSQWNAPNRFNRPGESVDALEAVRKDLDLARKEEADARDQVENVIPDEARRAGIPPGWLSEVQ